MILSEDEREINNCPLPSLCKVTGKKIICEDNHRNSTFLPVISIEFSLIVFGCYMNIPHSMVHKVYYETNDLF